MVAKFRKIYTSDYNIQKVQDAVEEIINPLAANALLGGVVCDNVSLSPNQDNPVAHKLGRAARYFFVLTKNANADVWESTTTNTFRSQYLLLKTDVAVTATFYIL